MDTHVRKIFLQPATVYRTFYCIANTIFIEIFKKISYSKKVSILRIRIFVIFVNVSLAFVDHSDIGGTHSPLMSEN